MLSPQSLSESDRRRIAAWAADCAERVLPLFTAEAPEDDRARDGIARARAFSRGELDVAGEIRLRFVAGRAAQSASSPAGKAAAWSAGQASGVAHMGAHALGAAAYAAKAAELAAPQQGGAAEIQWQLEHMSPPVRAALQRLPLLGEDPSGPLGSGLLASGVLGSNIRAVQTALCNTDAGSASAPTPAPGRGAPVTFSDLATRAFRIPRGTLTLAAVHEAPAGGSQGKAPLVIVMHGLSGSKDEPLVLGLARVLNAAGLATLRFDFNGHGESDGDSTDMTVPNEIDDALAAYRYARSLDSVSRIALLGHSQGGVVAGMIAGQLGDEISALALVAPAGILVENARNGNMLGIPFDPADPPAYVEPLAGGFRIGRQYMLTAQTLRVFGTSANYRGPVCIIHGATDDVVPVRTAERYRTLYDNPEFHLLPHQNHGFEHDPSEPATLAATFLAGHPLK